MFSLYYMYYSNVSKYFYFDYILRIIYICNEIIKVRLSQVTGFGFFGSGCLRAARGRRCSNRCDRTRPQVTDRETSTRYDG